MILALLITVLMVGAVMAVVAGEWNRNFPRWIALGACALGLLLVVLLWADSGNSVTEGQWLMHYR
jgi:NADH-quinone oxidoreductase subunit M